jgi:uncharacterized protein YlzI (FlbEa/FlbD family)
MGNSINKSETLDFYLEELLNKKYLEPIEKYVWDRFIIIHLGKYYLMKPEIENVIEACFNYLLQRKLVADKYYLNQNLLEKFKILPDGKKIKILKHQIKQENKILCKCIGEVNSTNNECNLKENWRKAISSDLIPLIHFIAFKLMKNNLKNLSPIVEELNKNYLPNLSLLNNETAISQLESFKYNSPSKSIIWVHELFPSKIEPVLTALSCFENITYLKELINTCNSKVKDVPSLQPEKVNVPNDSDINIFCPSMPITVATEYFEKLYKEGGTKKNPILTKEKVKLFIDRAFKGNDSIEKLTFDNISTKRGEIIDTFHKFYDLAVGGFYERTSNCKEKYIKLLTDNFNEFTYEKVKNNFRNKP